MKDFILNNNNILEYETHTNVSLFLSTNLDGSSKGNFSTLNLADYVGDDIENVNANLQIYAKKINMPIKNFYFTKQSHSDNFIEISDSNKLNDESFDAMFTFKSNIVLNIFCADCTPVYFIDETKNLIGVIHAGWQGTLKEITYKTLTYIIENYKINPDNLKVIIGPSISYESFEVEYDVYSKFLNKNLLNSSNSKQVSEVKYKIDIKKINSEQAIRAGVKDINISKIDTYTSDNLYSYRRNNTTGRMCASIYQTSN